MAARGSLPGSAASENGSAGGGARVGGVQLADWVGMPGARAAEAARSMGLRPAMELVDADGQVGVVVAQDPQPGAAVARRSLVTLFIASKEAADGDAEDGAETAQADDGGEPDDAGEPRECGQERLEAEADFEGEGSGWDLQADAQRGTARHAAAPRVVAGGVAAPRLTRVRWLLVLDGWRVMWPEGLLAAVLALAAAWGVGGGSGLAGVMAVASVMAALVLAARLAAGGEGDATVDADELHGDQALVVIDIQQRRRRWP